MGLVATVCEGGAEITDPTGRGRDKFIGDTNGEFVVIVDDVVTGDKGSVGYNELYPFQEPKGVHGLFLLFIFDVRRCSTKL
jgi:hypothetical protein